MDGSVENVHGSAGILLTDETNMPVKSTLIATLL